MADDTNRSLNADSWRTTLRGWARRVRAAIRRLEALYPLKSLTQLIIILNLFGFALLVGGALYFNQFRAGLIETKVQSLLRQGEIIASAIAATAASDASAGATRAKAGASGPDEDLGLGSLEFLINPERAAPDFGKLIQPTGTRARIYDRDGWLVLDSDAIFSRGQVSQFKPPPTPVVERDIITSIWERLSNFIWQQELPLYKEIGTENGKAYPEVSTALTGAPVPIVRVNESGELVVSVAVPIRQAKSVLGVLLLSTRGGEIDSIVAAERWVLIRVALVAVGVTMLLSIIMARTIAGPMRRLSAAADRVRASVKAREEIPDYTHRSDEIGHLSGALRDMTTALYGRIDAIESFAADVAHELKNPLTSLRSAAETLPRVRTKQARDQLVEVIQDDVKRLDRLLTDISDASRLDAELAREDAEPVDIVHLLNVLVPALNGANSGKRSRVVLNIEQGKNAAKNGYMVLGHDIRLGQVITNVLENAISFSPKSKRVYVDARRINGDIEITIEDSGPGIPPDNLTKIFDRFYTDRPGEEEFGRNSGLGLNISRQIVLAHGGRIWAENRTKTPAKNNGKSPTNTRARKSAGARFVIRLPAA